MYVRAGVSDHTFDERFVDIVHVKDSLERTFATRYVQLSPLFSLNRLINLFQCHEHFRHRRGHQAVGLTAQGQGYQAYHLGGEGSQEEARGAAVNVSSSSLSSFLSLCPCPCLCPLRPRHVPFCLPAPPPKIDYCMHSVFL